jgi:hypothetical protein
MENAEGSTTFAKLVLESGESAPYLVGRRIDVVLEEKKGIPHKLLLLPENAAHALRSGEGIGRLLCRLEFLVDLLEGSYNVGGLGNELKSLIGLLAEDWLTH